MTKIILKGYIVVPEEDLRAVTRELGRHVELTRAEDGCLVFEVTQDASSKHVFEVYEEFRDEKSFRQHQHRVRESKWGSITANVERHYEVRAVDEKMTKLQKKLRRGKLRGTVVEVGGSLHGTGKSEE